MGFLRGLCELCGVNVLILVWNRAASDAPTGRSWFPLIRDEAKTAAGKACALKHNPGVV